MEVKESKEQEEIEKAREFLCGFQLCLDLLNLRKYERKRAKEFDESYLCEDLLSGDESYWHARMYEVSALLGKMKNGREKLILYYHYVRGQSVEHSAGMIGVSRRTGYRLHRRGLLMVAHLMKGL